MHAILEQIYAELNAIPAGINGSMPNNEPVSVAHGNWSFPGITRDELITIATSLAESIRRAAPEELNINTALLTDYPRRISFLRAHTIPQLWTNAAMAVPAYIVTLHSLDLALRPYTTTEDKIPQETEEARALAADSSQRLKKLTTQIRGLEARYIQLEPRAATLSEKMELIEKVHEAADQFPADLESLREDKELLANLLKDATTDRAAVQTNSTDSKLVLSDMEKTAAEAKAIMARCEAAYTAATSQGLAAAFSHRSDAIAKSMWIWVFGLIVALSLGSYLGSQQIKSLAEMMKAPGVALSLILVNMCLSVLSVGAPIWFAWIATKQIGHRFKLAEDYGFKASISKAYEGYRSEAFRIDPTLQNRLFASALDRLDELPLRLIDPSNHGSPVQELLASPMIRQAARSVPGFAGMMKDFAKTALASVTSKKEAERMTTSQKEASE